MLQVKEGYVSISPADGEQKAFFPFMEDAEIEFKLKEAEQGFEFLKSTTFEFRKKLLYDIAAKIEEKAEDLALLVTQEMGKPISQAKAEIGKCAEMARYHADYGEKWLASESTDAGSVRYEFRQEALGPVLFISTWNNPFLQAILALVPQLIIGNSAIIKPAPNAARCALEMEKILEELKLPAKIYVTVLASIPQTEELILNKRVKGVTFIGSTKAGKRVGSLAGKAFKPAVIDAGGSDPMVILEDADLDEAAKTAAAARFGNTGQSCVAAKRIIVMESIKDKFLEAFIKATKAMTLGDPFDPSTQIGPLATHAARDLVKDQIEQSIEQGAALIYGGGIPDNPGAFIEPTILANVSCDMLPSKEEVFGPVAAIYTAKSVEEAIEYANDTPYGLGASVFSKTPERVIPYLVTGNVAVNSKVATNFPVPFGGIKDSGYGVYFGKEGLTTFTNTKVVSFPK